MTAPTTTSTTQTDQPDRLSFHRLQRLDNAAMLATALTVIGAVLAWLAITQWWPATFLPTAWQHGFRFGIIAVAYAALMLRVIEAVWDRTYGHARLAGGHPGPIPAASLNPALWVITALLSTPLWPAVRHAVAINDAGPLLNMETATRAALLAWPVIALAVLAHGVLLGVIELRWQLNQKQERELAELAGTEPAQTA